MAISQGDVRLVKSKVMLDTPEGGGGPTGIAIADGVANDIFPDVSSLDRVNGRVNARQIHLHINTDSLDMYLGANLIVSRPPEDENISITLVDTGEAFDTRADAIARVESYLFVGATWPGFLFGNHLAGMMVVSWYQRTAVGPAIGDTLVLTKREGYADEYKQYIRVTSVLIREQEFEDNQGVYSRYVVEAGISDPLRVDFQGFDATRQDILTDAVRLRTKVSKTVVANASRYYGVAQLAQPAAIGAAVARLESIFTQLVPSAQVETPILDARTNQTMVLSIAKGAVVTDRRPLVNFWNPSFPTIFIGAGVTPGTLRLSYPYWTDITDNGKGALFQGSLQVGVIDYANGVLTGTHNGTIYPKHDNAADNFLSVTYAPRALQDAITQNQGLPVTSGNRALNLVRTLPSIPVESTLAVDYRAQGNWYTLQDNGSGELRGTDPSFGAGTLNRQTGTMAVTFGALPDVGSAILVRWAEPATEVANSMLSVSNNGKLYIAANVDGVLGQIKASKAATPGALTLTWNDGVANRTVTDDGNGNLTGYGTGVVNYAEGWFRLSPTTLPPKGTLIMIQAGVRTSTSKTCPMSRAGGTTTIDVGEPVSPGSLSFYLGAQRRAKYKSDPIRDLGDRESYRITDDGTGKVLLSVGGIYDGAQSIQTTVQVGTVNYTTGLITLVDTELTGPQARINTKFINLYWLEYQYPMYDVAGQSNP